MIKEGTILIEQLMIVNKVAALSVNLFYASFLNPFSRSRFRHTVQRPGQIVCPNRDSVCPNSDKIYLTVVTFRFLLLFFAYYEKRDLISPFRFVDCPLLA